jgi:biotin carboxyl carrier protein
MHYEIEVGGRVRHVTVVRTGATFAVTVDGHTWNVDAARIDAHTLSLVLDSVWSKDVVIAGDSESGQLTVRVDGVVVDATLNGRRRRLRVAGGHTRSGPDRVVAPMPGKIVRVLVKPGQTVAPRQPLVVVEAMKMENELRAGRDGVVAEVHAAEGQSVDAGALLIVIQ